MIVKHCLEAGHGCTGTVARDVLVPFVCMDPWPPYSKSKFQKNFALTRKPIGVSPELTLSNAEQYFVNPNFLMDRNNFKPVCGRFFKRHIFLVTLSLLIQFAYL